MRDRCGRGVERCVRWEYKERFDIGIVVRLVLFGRILLDRYRWVARSVGECRFGGLYLERSIVNYRRDVFG